MNIVGSQHNMGTLSEIQEHSGTWPPQMPPGASGVIRVMVLVPGADEPVQRAEDEVAKLGSTWTHVDEPMGDEHTPPSGHDVCGICMDAYEAGDSLTSLPCSTQGCCSVWHAACIRKWLCQSHELSCPLCRAAIECELNNATRSNRTGQVTLMMELSSNSGVTSLSGGGGGAASAGDGAGRDPLQDFLLMAILASADPLGEGLFSTFLSRALNNGSAQVVRTRTPWTPSWTPSSDLALEPGPAPSPLPSLPQPRAPGLQRRLWPEPRLSEWQRPQPHTFETLARVPRALPFRTEVPNLAAARYMSHYGGPPGAWAPPPPSWEQPAATATGGYPYGPAVERGGAAHAPHRRPLGAAIGARSQPPLRGAASAAEDDGPAAWAGGRIGGAVGAAIGAARPRQREAEHSPAAQAQQPRFRIPFARMAPYRPFSGGAGRGAVRAGSSRTAAPAGGEHTADAATTSGGRHRIVYPAAGRLSVEL